MGKASVVSKAISGSSQQLESVAVNYHGFTLRETAGAAATVRIRSGGSTGVIIDDIAFAANEAVADYYVNGLRTDTGLYVEIVTGAVEGSVRIG